MKAAPTAVVIVLYCILSVGFCDVYFQNPRGCNDRLNENSADRQNGNRLYNTENNARGGYCYGPAMNYYAGSKLSLEWTAQHACGDGGNTKCNYVLQYMCGYADGPEEIRIRDGTTTNTPPDNKDTFNTKDANDLFVYGMHESYQYYQACKGRSRNAGLFTSDQNIGGGGGATKTRQNAGGARYGFECSEERDYYPYWAPTPWKDIAVLTTNSKKMCSYYQKESQNVKSKQFCNGNPAINEQDCKSGGGSWDTTPAWGIDEPDCDEAPYSRDNHLGNGINGFMNSYNWTLPTEETEKCVVGGKCNCVLRIRYNITTAEMDGWGFEDGKFDDSSLNKNPPIATDPYIWVAGANLSLAVDTSQYGRTFQDRSYVFTIRPRPKGVSAKATIWNLNVRGKRGNIVQVYPATEYDFVPQQLTVKVGGYIHFQWTGCDTNPDNEGEGTKRTDRSNIVQMHSPQFNRPITDEEFATNSDIVPLFDKNTRVKMAHIGQTDCKSLEQLLIDNANQDAVDQDPNNCMKLNSAGPYFDGGLIEMTKTGTFYFMSTRNNNFSNRTQKGVLIVSPLLEGWAIALIVIGAVVFASVASIGGLFFYSRANPHSAVATKFYSVLNKIRRRG
jgi:hypothetical protein